MLHCCSGKFALTQSYLELKNYIRNAVSRHQNQLKENETSGLACSSKTQFATLESQNKDSHSFGPMKKHSVWKLFRLMKSRKGHNSMGFNFIPCCSALPVMMDKFQNRCQQKKHSSSSRASLQVRLQQDLNEEMLTTQILTHCIVLVTDINCIFHYRKQTGDQHIFGI